MDEKKVLLSVKDLEVKFHVRGRILTAIRGISLDIYENESIAIVGESGSGKSVFTKTFAGMLDSNGFISRGDIIFNDEELSTTNIAKDKQYRIISKWLYKRVDKLSKYNLASKQFNELEELLKEEESKKILSIDKLEQYQKEIDDHKFKYTELLNYKLTLDSKNDKDEIAKNKEDMSCEKAIIEEIEKQRQVEIKQHKQAYYADKEHLAEVKSQIKELKEEIKILIQGDFDKAQRKLNAIIGKEIYLSVGRYPLLRRIKLIKKLFKEFEVAFKHGLDLSDDEVRNKVFDKVVFRVKLVNDNDEMLFGRCLINLAKVSYSKDWQQIRGTRVATVFQDPMTSLNPILTIGNQISSVIMKHQHVSEEVARVKAIELMRKVGIPNAENRYEDYPFQYSGGMRQRIVIAIALSCQPKILICDEPTTALDVTIQAQILKLIKDLQKEFNYTIVFITHDLGVVANVAERVAVLYAGQIVELGTCEEVFYEPSHPYTWALLSSLPQLASKEDELYSIAGTPPSLYNKIIGDPFAPRNPYCLKIDTIQEAPMFKISETHYAKTWLLDPRAPKIERPKVLNNIHTKILEGYNIKEGK